MLQLTSFYCLYRSISLLILQEFHFGMWPFWNHVPSSTCSATGATKWTMQCRLFCFTWALGSWLLVQCNSCTDLSIMRLLLTSFQASPILLYIHSCHLNIWRIFQVSNIKAWSIMTSHKTMLKKWLFAYKYHVLKNSTFITIWFWLFFIE